jgi:type III pantothenate kinase
MLLAVDIGNTNISFGVFKGRRMAKKFHILTATYRPIQLKRALGKLMVSDAVICSVVPRLTKLLGRDLKKITGKRPYIIGKDIPVPIRNLYRCPRQVGQDRLVNAYAGIKLYGAPLIVVDFGTAVTFDVISKRKEYLGGMVLPGLGISLEALHQRTALLPKVKLARPTEFIGRDTKNSILSGIVYGLAALADGLVARIKAKIGKRASVIATGGDANLMFYYCNHINKIDTGLTLKGANFVYERIKK